MTNSSGSDGADNVNETYTVNASTEAGTGTWKLRVRDVYSSDTGGRQVEPAVLIRR